MKNLLRFHSELFAFILLSALTLTSCDSSEEKKAAGGEIEDPCLAAENFEALPAFAAATNNSDLIVTTECLAIFVSPTGDDTNSGTKELPMRTISAALTKADAAAKTRVYVDQGTYTENITLIDRISIWGSFDSTDNWSRAATNHTTLIADSVITTDAGDTFIAVAGESISNTTYVGDIKIQTGNALASGQSVYALHCLECGGLNLLRSELTVGNAFAGQAGTSGASGASGSAANSGTRTINVNSKGTPGNGGPNSSCPTANGGIGGEGGQAFASNGENGSAPASGAGTGGSAGLSTSPPFAGSAGGSGSSAFNGTGGAAVASTATLSTNGFVEILQSGSGSAGTNGTGGGGGGGGGGDASGIGGGGGGGGAGGCAGTGGVGGKSGGHSVAIFLGSSSGAVLTDNVITAGNAGNGGTGGNGAAGGSATSGASGGGGWSGGNGAGGAGGNGTAGGRGGGGAGGPGGVSYAVIFFDTTGDVTALTDAGNDLTAGTAGIGGVAGTSPGGNQGQAGTAGATGNFISL